SRRGVGVAPAPAIRIEISRQDRLDRARGDIELGKARQLVRQHIVFLQKLDLIRREFQRPRRKLQKQRLDIGQRNRQRQQKVFTVDLFEHHFHQFAEGVDGGAAQLENLPVQMPPHQDIHHRVVDIADINRLKQRLAATDQGQRRQKLRQRGKAVEKIVFRT